MVLSFPKYVGSSFLLPSRGVGGLEIWVKHFGTGLTFTMRIISFDFFNFFSLVSLLSQHQQISRTLQLPLISPACGRGWNEVVFKVHSNPNQPVILQFHFWYCNYFWSSNSRQLHFPPYSLLTLHTTIYTILFIPTAPHPSSPSTLLLEKEKRLGSRF